MHEASVNFGIEFAVYAQSVNPTLDSVENTAFIVIDDAQSLNAFVGKALVFNKLP